MSEPTKRANTPAGNTASSTASSGEREAQGQPAQGQRPSVWGASSTRLDDWIAINTDGTITAYSGKVELGTGVRTALAQIVAEELDVPSERILLVMGDTERTPNEGYTAGSMTIRMGGTALRNAAAEARQALLEQAAERFEAPLEALATREGMVVVREAPSRRVSYADLMGGKRFDRGVTGTAPKKPVAEYAVVGSDVPRVDLPAIFFGHAPFVQNLRLPGMLHARILRPPSEGAILEALDASAIPAGVRVVRRGSLVGVLAAREIDTIRAVDRLKPAWRETQRLPQPAQLYDWMRAQPAQEAVVAESGSLEAAMAGAAQRIAATYHQPFQAHASTGPSCAVAHLLGGELTVWCSTQGVFPLRGALADLLQMPPERIHVIYVEGSGCYGQNGQDDVAAFAAALASALDGEAGRSQNAPTDGEVAGRPVRVQFSREDEFAWEPKTPAMLMRLRAGLDADGRIVAWQDDVWSPSHSGRPRAGLQLVAGQMMTGEQPEPSAFLLGGDRNAATNYTLPNQRVTLHWLARTALRSSSMRTLGAVANTFANECFMDELAAAAGVDPLEFRLRHLDDPRARDALKAAAEHAGWGTPLPSGSGRGLAYAQYENSQAYVAAVADVQVDAASGAARVTRIVVAHDCGLVVNPNGLRNQIEGNVVQSLSRALKEEVRFDTSRQLSLDWDSYPILTFSEMPDVEVVLLNRPDEPSVGAGEPASVTTAPAVANAIFAATGARLRQAPFTPERVRAAMLATRR